MNGTEIIVLILGIIIGVFNIIGLCSIIGFLREYKKDIQVYEKDIAQLKIDIEYLKKYKVSETYFYTDPITGKTCCIKAEDLDKQIK